MKAVFVVLFIGMFAGCGFSQQTFFVKDGLTEEPIPFVKAWPNIGDPVLADIDGKLEFASEVESVKLRQMGYMDTVVNLKEVTGNTIFLDVRLQNIQEVTVLPGENPAHRIIQKAIENRKANHPVGKESFTYNSYSKFVVGMNDEVLADLPESGTDSSMIEMRDFFEKQHLFLMESASKRTYFPPNNDKEEITAYRVSGFSDPLFSTFANSLQSFSFYENQFNLLGKTYVNPIARGGIRRYLFILEDTTIVNQDTTFTIFYRPRRGKVFEGLTGRLYINTNGFAVEKVVAEPYADSNGIILKIVQEYALAEGRKWFPEKLSTQIEVPFSSGDENVEPLYLIGKGNSYIRDVVLNPDEKKRFNNNIVLESSEDVELKDEARWKDIRELPSTGKDSTTYVQLDSLSEAMNFGRFVQIFKILASGKVPLGKKFNLDLMRLATFSQFEGYRLGLGLETSREWIKPVLIGGYFAWGTRDKDWKFGGYTSINLSKKRNVYLDLKYQQDVVERGGVRFNETTTLGSDLMYRYFFINQMDRERKASVRLNWDIKANVELGFIGNYRRIWFHDDYSYQPESGLFNEFDRDIDLAETGIELHWMIGQKFVLLGNRKVVHGKRKPSVRLKVIKGWKGFIESNFDYVRLNAEIGHTTQIRGIGALQWKLSGAHVIGDVPLTLTHNGVGTGRMWNLSVANTFETMPAGAFYTTSQVNAFMRFRFKAISTKADWNEPRFSLHHAIGYGTFDKRSDHSLSFETMDKGYTEAGIILDGILTSSFTSIGLGAFYVYGPYSNPVWDQNITAKISVAFSLD